jgi:hypothetical protein
MIRPRLSIVTVDPGASPWTQSAATLVFEAEIVTPVDTTSVTSTAHAGYPSMNPRSTSNRDAAMVSVTGPAHASVDPPESDASLAAAPSDASLAAAPSVP